MDFKIMQNLILIVYILQFQATIFHTDLIKSVELNMLTRCCFCLLCCTLNTLILEEFQKGMLLAALQLRENFKTHCKSKLHIKLNHNLNKTLNYVFRLIAITIMASDN